MSRGKRSPLNSNRSMTPRQLAPDNKRRTTHVRNKSMINRLVENGSNNLGSVDYATVDGIMRCLKAGKTPQEIKEILDSPEVQAVSSFGSIDSWSLVHAYHSLNPKALQGEAKRERFDEDEAEAKEYPERAMTKVIHAFKKEVVNDWDEISAKVFRRLMIRAPFTQFRYHREKTNEMRDAVDYYLSLD